MRSWRGTYVSTREPLRQGENNGDEEISVESGLNGGVPVLFHGGKQQPLAV